MKKPQPPLLRVVADGTLFRCPYCNSSIETKFFGLLKLGCMNKECKNSVQNKKV